MKTKEYVVMILSVLAALIVLLSTYQCYGDTGSATEEEIVASVTVAKNQLKCISESLPPEKKDIFWQEVETLEKSGFLRSAVIIALNKIKGNDDAAIKEATNYGRILKGVPEGVPGERRLEIGVNSLRKALDSEGIASRFSQIEVAIRQGFKGDIR